MIPVHRPPKRRRSIAAAIACMVFAATESPRASMIVYTNDVMGEIEPCGCRNNPLGGVVRKLGLLAETRKKDPEILQFDAGNFLFPTEIVPETLRVQSEYQASILIRAHEQMGLDAVTPGPKDFALGIAAFNRLTQKANFPFLAANLRAKAGAPLNVLPEKIWTLNSGKKIAVLGLVGEKLPWPNNLVTSSPVATTKEWATRMRTKVDFLLVLSHLGLEGDRNLARQVRGIDFILGSETQSFLQTPEKISDTLIFQSSFRNQYVGRFPIEKNLDSERHELLPLEPRYEAGGGDLVPLVREFKAHLASLSKSSVENSPHAKKGAPAVRAYATFPNCVQCHAEIVDFWRKTAHAQALRPLMESGQHANRECIACHSAGFGKSGGFHDPLIPGRKKDGSTLSPELLHSFLKEVLGAPEWNEGLKNKITDLDKSYPPVQCENCHGPAGDHPFAGSYTKSVDQKQCLSCHTYERAPNWYNAQKKPDPGIIATKLKKVQCPKGTSE